MNLQIGNYSNIGDDFGRSKEKGRNLGNFSYK